MRPFAELGALIEGAWREKNYGEETFPAIASGALSDSKLPARVDPWDIIRWVHSTTELPEQMDLTANFGNPPITLYVGPRFFIDAYYWLDSTTSIHQHSFSGAFQVLLGSSVHARYNFEKELEINSHFHLDRPSVTITIRSYKAPSDAVQFSYLKPYLARNPFFTDALLKRKVQTVE